MKGEATMATIVNVLEKGKRIELINAIGTKVVFTDRPDGCHYEVRESSGRYVSGKARTMKNARHTAIEFLEKKGRKELAHMLHPDYRPQRKSSNGYLPCPAVLPAAPA